MQEDIRDRPALKQDDILKLNFIRAPGSYVYNRHYRAGLRSHIMEVLYRGDWEKGEIGVLKDRLTWFPRARPLKMLRIFRTRFKNLNEAEEELRRVKTIEAYLAPDHLASSEEFLASYRVNRRWELLLCGLQEFVEGEILDPWGRFEDRDLAFIFSHLAPETHEDMDMETGLWIRTVRKRAEYFIGKLKEMISKTRHVPDLAGIGNLLLTRSGDIKLVDINNISTCSFENTIQLDDRGYPVCDKSVEALFLLEREFMCRPVIKECRIYRTFLDPQRMNEVKAIEEAFHHAMGS
jgi:hypothetical protein